MSKSCFASLLLVFLIWPIQFAPTVSADDFTVDAVQIGIGGQCKLGHWVPVRVLISTKSNLPDNLRVEVSLPDTDGIPAIFVDSHSNVATNESGAWVVKTIGKLGNAKGNGTVRILDDAGNELAKKDFSIPTVCTPVDSLTELYVSFGKSIEINSGARIGETADHTAAVAVALDQSSTLFERPEAYDSIDALLLETSAWADNPLSEDVQTALEQWVQGGGRVAVIGGRNFREVFEANPFLNNLIESKPDSIRRMRTTSALERIVKAETPITDQLNRPYLTVFSNPRGEILIPDGDAPVVLRRRYGFGHVLLVTTNLGEAPFDTWEERKRLTGYLISQLNFATQQGSRKQFRTSRYGYQDLSGQLRGALDAFESVSIVNFTLVAAIAILFIALIGPGDYFFLKKFVGRMEWTWLTFLCIVIAISALTFWIFVSSKPDRLILRQVEIVDMDLETGAVRGSGWTHIYSPSSQRYDLTWSKPQEAVTRTRSISSWQGFPGDALGGMGNNASTATESSRYQMQVSAGVSELVQMPVNVAATKGIYHRWHGTTSMKSSSYLQIRRSTVTGRIENPLDVDLENVFVVYQRSMFQFKPKLKAGESFDLVTDTTERGVADYLNRRRVKEMGTETTPWNVTDTDINRIAEVMMFYDKAGGQGYVNLLQRYQTDIDFSNLVNADYGILVGRTKTPGTQMVVGDETPSDAYEEVWTYYRILIPVRR